MASVLHWLAPKDEQAERQELVNKERLRAIALEHIEGATARMKTADEVGHASEASAHSELALGWWQSITGTA